MPHKIYIEVERSGRVLKLRHNGVETVITERSIPGAQYVDPVTEAKCPMDRHHAYVLLQFVRNAMK